MKSGRRLAERTMMMDAPLNLYCSERADHVAIGIVRNWRRVTECRRYACLRSPQ